LFNVRSKNKHRGKIGDRKNGRNKRKENRSMEARKKEEKMKKGKRCLTEKDE
jgi:hypothetical protein